MSTQTTCHLHIPKKLHVPVAKYITRYPMSVGKLLQLALIEKLQREGYLDSQNQS